MYVEVFTREQVFRTTVASLSLHATTLCNQVLSPRPHHVIPLRLQSFSRPRRPRTTSYKTTNNDLGLCLSVSELQEDAEVERNHVARERTSGHGARAYILAAGK